MALKIGLLALAVIILTWLVSQTNWYANYSASGGIFDEKTGA